MKIFFSIFPILFCLNLSAHAASGSSGSHSIGFGVGYTGASQTDLNSWSSAQNAAGAQLTSGFEYSFTYIYRFTSSMFALALRPSYISESAGATGVNNSLTGIILYPILRIYPLENSFIHFFIQGGIGWGSLTGTTNFNGNSITYSGSDFGALAGLGAEFCFTDHQCMTIEGDARYHAIPRSTISSSSGNWNGTLTGPIGHELEYNGTDVGNTMSGIQGILQYTLKF